MSPSPCAGSYPASAKSQSLVARLARKKVFGSAVASAFSRSEKWVHGEVASRLLRQGRIALSVYRVWKALIDRHNSGNGLCFPSFDTVAADAGVSRRSVAYALKILEGLGVLSWAHRLKRRAPGSPPERSSNSYIFKRFAELKDALRFVGAMRPSNVSQVSPVHQSRDLLLRNDVASGCGDVALARLHAGGRDLGGVLAASLIPISPGLERSIARLKASMFGQKTVIS